MFHSDDVSGVQKLLEVLRLELTLVDHLPLVKVLRAVGFQLFEHLVRVFSSDGRSWSKVGGVLFQNDLILLEVFRDVNVAVVLDVVEDDVVVEDYCFAVLAVLVPLLDVKGNSLG